MILESWLTTLCWQWTCFVMVQETWKPTPQVWWWHLSVWLPSTIQFRNNLKGRRARNPEMVSERDGHFKLKSECTSSRTLLIVKPFPSTSWWRSAPDSSSSTYFHSNHWPLRFGVKWKLFKELVFITKHDPSSLQPNNYGSWFQTRI